METYRVLPDRRLDPDQTLQCTLLLLSHQHSRNSRHSCFDTRPPQWPELPSIPSWSVSATEAQLKFVPFDRMTGRTCSPRSVEPALSRSGDGSSYPSAVFRKLNSRFS